ncbi:MAG: pyridoxamine 5'-phosphate oxidase [Proteobacteria bacterium]|nr:pyridoxamine 5'-phosphate oxidase [Pseudomonadota bacterium]
MERTKEPAELANLRREYKKAALDESSLCSDPLTQFERWFAEATAAVSGEANAMALATVGRDGAPSLRMVLLKGYGPEGFRFFTNYLSRKGEELSSNNKAALLFYWGELERQVRIEGTVSLVSAADSDAYFASRPRGAQLGAIASEQSSPLASRAELEKAVASLEAQYAGRPLPRPLNWGGFSLAPESFEFWQGREDRLHDRVTFTRTMQGGWVNRRLAP